MQVNLKMRERKHLENLSCGKGGKDSNGSGVASHRGKKQKSTLSECEHEQKTFEEGDSFLDMGNYSRERERQ